MHKLNKLSQYSYVVRKVSICIYDMIFTSMVYVHVKCFYKGVKTFDRGGVKPASYKSAAPLRHAPTKGSYFPCEL